MKIKTLLFGGAFDPPHKSHINTAGTALAHKKFSDGTTELWFMPCYSDAFGQKDLTDPKHRIAMLNSVVNYMGNCTSVCTTEIEMANKAGAYAVVKELIRRYPEREFYYVIGSDQACRIREWRNSRDLLKTIPFVVIKREGINRGSHDWCFSDSHIWIDKPINMFVFGDGHAHTSSYIRECFHKDWKNQKENKHKGLLVAVHEYIVNHNLYK